MISGPGFSDLEVVQAFPEYDVSVPCLGRGNFKVAYLIRAGSEERVLKVVLEPIEPDLDGEYALSSPGASRISREISGMANVKSEHLVSMLSEPRIVQVGQGHHIAYEEVYYPGGTLADRLSSGALSESETRRLVKALLNAVYDLWDQQKIVHRDIKPGNIVFDSVGNPVLLDLGIALYTEMSDLTDSLLPSPKTPWYAAPEQFIARRFSRIDFRTDLFQIGIVAYESIAGRHPFRTVVSVSQEEYGRLLSDGPPTSVSHLPCSESMQDLIARLLAKRPSGRFRSVGQALSMLEGME